MKELRKFNFNRTHPEYVHAMLPTLEEVYDLLRNTKLTINVELKIGIFFYEGIEERVLGLTRRMKMDGRVWYSSFNHYSVERIKSLNPEAQAGILYMDGYVDIPDYAEKLGMSAIHPIIYNLQYPELMERCREKGLAVHVWTVNNENDLQLCYDAGVDAVITNYPDVAKAYIATRTGDIKR